MEVDLTEARSEHPLVYGDIEPFVSPIDGTIVSGRAAWREHDKRHGVTNVADFTNQWEGQRKERESFFNGDSRYDRKERIEALKHAYEKHTRRK